ncbi:FMN-binding negative transcriptional regulator [Ideonella sp. BN130291]|uniref:FMN-binding negative transcriptional regulator n=1 Tax=Ideonella sp. BN130291 TaxID=3112940 RepID=UPI002E26C0A7|nr:FMN-binding negative transcriptional regulator [Ideonella sp. BN130291]
MYQPRHFVQDDPTELQALMQAHPLATLVRQAPDGSLSADHIPLLYDAADGEHGTLRGHVARANPLWQELAAGAPVLAIFQGPQAYVSPAWYASKREHGKVVPTWNYAVVHAHGRFHAKDDPVWLRAFLQRLTARHEGPRAEPWQIDDAPADFTAQLLGAIVGIEIPLLRLEGKWKVSQNRPAADREGVTQGLLAEGSDAGTAAMAQLVRRPGMA